MGTGLAEQDRHWASLMARAQDGDPGAYHALLGELLPKIRGFCEKRLGYLGQGMGEDVVQESLIAIHRYRHTYDPTRPFGAWVFSIVRHKIVDLLRERRLNVDTGPEQLEQQPDPAPSQSDVLLAGKLDRSLASLPKKYRDVIVAFKVDGHPIAEIAAQQGLGESAVKMRLRRGLALLRKKLEKELRDVD